MPALWQSAGFEKFSSWFSNYVQFTDFLRNESFLKDSKFIDATVQRSDGGFRPDRVAPIPKIRFSDLKMCVRLFPIGSTTESDGKSRSHIFKSEKRILGIGATLSG